MAEAIQTPIASLNCPAQPELNAGDHISCEAVAAGQTFAIAVTMTDTAGQFTWQTRGLLVLSKLEDFIQTRLRERGVAVQADCGGALRVAQPKETFKCQVSDATGQIREVSVIVKDEQGNVDISLL